MKKSFKTVLGFIVLAIFLWCAVLGTAYFLLTKRSERELWRITEYRVTGQILTAGDTLLFEGYKKDDSTDCVCVYAVDKNKGTSLWNTEELARPHIQAWKRLRSDSQTIPGTVTINSISEADGMIYLNINGETIYALNSLDGRVLWKVDVKDFAFSNEAIFVEDEKNNLSALDRKTGAEMWRKPIGYPGQDTSWLQYEGNIIFYIFRQGDRERFLAFAAQTGRKLWESSTRQIAYIAAVSDQQLYVSNLDDWSNRTSIYVSALSLADGEQIWEVPFQDYALLSVEPRVSEDQTFVLMGKNRDTFYRVASLTVLDRQTGQLLWEFNQDFSHGSIAYSINGEIVYVGTEDGAVYSLDRKTGRQIWKTSVPASPTYFLVDRNTLIVAFEEKYVAALDTRTGAQKWLLSLDADTIYGQSWDHPEQVIKLHNGILYVSSTKPAIYAVDIASGKVVWSWQHNRLLRQHSGYSLGLLDGDVLYVTGGRGLFDLAQSGLFALKANP